MKKRIETVDFNVYVLFLFKIEPTVTKANIIDHCRCREVSQPFNAVFNAFIFFTDDVHAVFPKNKATYIYDSLEEEEATKYIKAIYVSNNSSGFSKLFHYPINYFYGEPEEIYYLDDFMKKQLK
ncbi:hypothetical protein RYH73_21560 [Olivibacter sp. CPCC 100613]|uniref:hypothetical protein n=1 Tax=Olivibacter sp. CPCC 100613 TaxID=3079931 RepID=UPI002FFC7FB6